MIKCDNIVKLTEGVIKRKKKQLYEEGKSKPSTKIRERLL
jgi:hypothetical protein